MDVASLAQATTAPVRLHWLRLDEDRSGPAFSLDLKVTASQGPGSTDLHAIGRTGPGRVTWPDLCQTAEKMPGAIEQVHGFFELKAVLDPAGGLRQARWTQSQLLHVRSPQAGRNGFESILSSASGVLAPSAPL